MPFVKNESIVKRMSGVSFMHPFYAYLYCISWSDSKWCVS